ncbi:MAG: hypothetical protein ACRDFT_01820 [bacterium]
MPDDLGGVLAGWRRQRADLERAIEMLQDLIANAVGLVAVL